MKLARRTALGGAIAWAALPAAAEDKPLRMVLGVPPGASADTITRVVAEKMGKALGRTVVVENKTGAGGIVANMAVKQATPDGNTLLMTPLATMVAFPHSYAKLDYDPFRDFAPVAHVASFQLAFGIGAQVPAKTLAEYVALARKGGPVTDFATPAPGSLPHFFGLMFAKAAGIELTHVPYKGGAPAMQALLSGEIGAAVLTLSDLGQQARGGKVRVLATSGGARSPQYPELPTFKESGYDIEGSGWYALFAPAGTPPEVVGRLSAAAIDALHQADLKERFGPLGLEPTGLGPTELSAILRADYDKWGPIIRASGFRAD